MSPTIPPDPDMRFADSEVGASLSSAARALTAAAAEMDREVRQLREQASGSTPAAKLNELTIARQTVDRQATVAAAGAALHVDMRTAAGTFHRAAPTVGELEADWDEVESLRTEMVDIARSDASLSESMAAQRRLDAAEQRFYAKLQLRESAISAHQAATEAALERYRQRCRSVGVEPEVDSPGERRGPRPDAPGTPGGPRPVVPAPSTPPAAVTPPPAAPAPSAGSGSDSQAALDNLISQIQRSSPVQAQPQQPAAQQAQPQAPAAMAAPLGGAPVSQARRNDAIDSRDVDRLIDDDKSSDAPTAVGLGLGSTGPTTTSSPAPTAPSSAPPPATNPGQSATGLNTSTPTNGRAGVDPGAFDSPQTRTSSAGPTATAAETGTGTRPGAGMGHGAPLIPPVGGVGGGGGGMSPRESRDAPRVYSPEQEQAGEGPDIVRGGTIAQNRPDTAA